MNLKLWYSYLQDVILCHCLFYAWCKRVFWNFHVLFFTWGNLSFFILLASPSYIWKKKKKHMSQVDNAAIFSALSFEKIDIFRLQGNIASWTSDFIQRHGHSAVTTNGAKKYHFFINSRSKFALNFDIF